MMSDQPPPVGYARAPGAEGGPGPRPGGLTALAVINFVLAGFGLLGLLGTLAGSAAMDLVPTTQMSAEDREAFTEAKQLMKDPTVKVLAALDIVPIGLLIVAGVGYLRQKKITGRTIGNLYAACSVLLTVAEMAFLPIPYGAGVTMLSYAIAFVYPLLTLFFINFTFRDDLVQ